MSRKGGNRKRDKNKKVHVNEFAKFSKADAIKTRMDYEEANKPTTPVTSPTLVQPSRSHYSPRPTTSTYSGATAFSSRTPSPPVTPPATSMTRRTLDSETSYYQRYPPKPRPVNWDPKLEPDFVSVGRKDLGDGRVEETYKDSLSPSRVVYVREPAESPKQDRPNPSEPFVEKDPSKDSQCTMVSFQDDGEGNQIEFYRNSQTGERVRFKRKRNDLVKKPSPESPKSDEPKLVDWDPFFKPGWVYVDHKHEEGRGWFEVYVNDKGEKVKHPR
jgi:hypothetical protein